MTKSHNHQNLFCNFFSCFSFPYDINAKNPHLFYRKKKSGKENRALFIFIYSRFYRVFLFRKLQKKSCLLWCLLLISFNVTYYARKRCERDFFNALLMDFHKQFMFVREIFRFFCLFFASIEWVQVQKPLGVSMRDVNVPAVGQKGVGSCLK